MTATSRCTLDGKYRYSVPSATCAPSATSRICTASYPPRPASAVAARRIRSRRSACRGVSGTPVDCAAAGLVGAGGVVGKGAPRARGHGGSQGGSRRGVNHQPWL